LIAGCALLAASACSNDKPKKKPLGGAGGAFEGGLDGSGGGVGGTGGSAGLDAGPDVVDASKDVATEAQPEAAPPPPPLFFSVSPGALGQTGSGVAQQTSPQSVVYGSATAASAPSAGSNVLVAKPSELGLDPLDDIDAVSVRKPMPAHPFYYFSVDDAYHFYRGTDVDQAAYHYTQRGDVFLSDGIVHDIVEGTEGFNGLYSTGLSVGLGQHSTGTGDAGTEAGADAATDAATGTDAGPGLVDDNLDALEIGVTPANAGTAYFSVDPGASGAAGSSVASTAAGERGCTIYASGRDGKNHVVYSCAQIGLASGDNVDALAVVDTGSGTRVYFSVDATTVGAAGTDVNGDTQSQYNPYRADIFYSDGDNTNHLAVDATGFALGTDYDVDALAIVDDPRDPLYVPSGNCTLSPSPVAPVDGGVTYNYYIAGNISGSLELFYAENATAGDQFSAYDLATCQRVGQPVAGSYAVTGSGDIVPVPQVGWSAAQPLSNLDVWFISANVTSIDLERIDLATGQTLAAYTTAVNDYVYSSRTIYLPGKNQFAVVSDDSIILIDVPAGNPGDAGVVTLPPSTLIDKYCYGSGQALGFDPSGFIEQAFLSDPSFTPLETRDCRLRLDGYPAQPYRPWDQGSLGGNLDHGVILPDQALYLFERQNNDIQVHAFAPPSTVDGGVPDGGSGDAGGG
jgi:hypothetical protein